MSDGPLGFFGGGEAGDECCVPVQPNKVHHLNDRILFKSWHKSVDEHSNACGPDRSKLMLHAAALLCVDESRAGKYVYSVCPKLAHASALFCRLYRIPAIFKYYLSRVG